MRSPTARGASRLVPANGWDRATALVVLALTVLSLATAGDYGASYDEDLQRSIGDNVVAWYASGFDDRAALGPGTTGDHFLYGGTFDATAELLAGLVPLDALVVRHGYGALWGIAGLVGTALLARRLGGARAGLLAAVLLATTPAWWGHGFINPKDIPFAAPVPWFLLGLFRASERLPAWSLRGVLAAGVPLGVALGVRPGGLLVLVPLAALTWLVRGTPAVRAAHGADRARTAAGLLTSLLALLAVAWLLMLAGWPWGQVNPVSGPLLVARKAAAFHTGVLIRFDGAWMWSFDAPRDYALRYLALTLPETWFVAWAGCLALAARGRPEEWRRFARSDALLCAAAGGLPILGAIAARSNLYDGVRHLLFVLPPLAAASAAGFSSALDRSPAPVRRVAAAVAAATTLLVARDAAALHPYEYVYYNRLVAGGVARAGLRYDLDFWGTSYREGIEWVARDPGLRARRPLRVAVLGPAFLASHWLRAIPGPRSHILVAGSSSSVLEAPADVVLSTTRTFGHRTPGEVLHVVERSGAPLLYVIDLESHRETVRRDLEAGDAAVALTLPGAALVRLLFRAGEPLAGYTIEWPAAGGSLDLLIRTPAMGGSADWEDVRQAAVRMLDEALSDAPPAGPLEPIWGPEMAGWRSSGWRVDGDAREEVVAGAARVGGCTVSFVARAPAGPGRMATLIDALVTMGPSAAGPRRRP